MLEWTRRFTTNILMMRTMVVSFHRRRQRCVLRGGSLNEDEFDQRSAYRFGANTSNQNFNVGFRCANSYSALRRTD